MELHPQAADLYRAKVAAIREALSKGDEAAREAISLVRELIGTVRVIPKGSLEPVGLEITGNLAALMRRPDTGEEHRQNGVPMAMVAGACNQLDLQLDNLLRACCHTSD